MHAIRIGEAWWRVEFSDTLPPDVDGLCRYEDQTILLRAGMDERNMLSTAFHEATHASIPDLCEDAVVRAEAALMGVYDWWVKLPSE